MTSQRLFTVDPTPGLFTADSALANPYPHRLRAHSDDDNDTFDAGRQIKKTNSFFLPGVWSAKDELSSGDVAWHMYSGMRQGFDLSFPGKKWNTIAGWGNLFSSTIPERYRDGNESSDITEVGMKRRNLEVYTQHQMTHAAGALFGSRKIEDTIGATARWISPTGIQFKWHNVFSKAISVGQRIRYLFLIYHDNWAPTRLLYAPIVYNGQFTNRESYTKGNDILSTDPDENVGDKGGHSSGLLVGFVDPNSMSVIKDKYTTSACVGMYLAMDNVEYDWASYDKVYNFWDFKPLFDTRPNQSLIIYPQPHSLKERMESGRVKLL